mmetsp:Transcript_67190/g.216769  ORF Transcript_67190/g.216769 Transcript_67190/m.216769 type:complete len:200 (+) Transcript_67190:1665-2264(+)
MRCGHPRLHRLDKPWLVRRVKALRGPEVGARHELDALVDILRLERHHLPNHNGTGVSRSQHIGVVLVDCQLPQQVGRELHGQAPIGQRIRHPANLRHVLRANKGQILSHSRCDLVAHLCSAHVPCDNREAAGIGAQHHGHGARNALVVHEEREIFLEELPIVVSIVLLEELVGLRALQGGDAVHCGHVLKVLGRDEARV